MAVILLAWGVSWLQGRSDQARVDRHFRQVSDQLVSTLKERLAIYEHGLRGARGAIIAAGPQLTRERFVAYSDSREYRTEFPGVGGYGYIQRVAPAECAAFVDQAGRDGAPGFDIRQLSPHQGELFVILYLEPAGENRAAIGLDIASEPNRRASALEAARTGRATMSRPITLVQRTEDARHGLLLLLPVYVPNMDLSSDEARWNATRGWVFAPLSIETVLGTLDHPEQPYRLSLADAGEGAGRHPFYASADFDTRTPDSLATTHELDIHGRTWILEVRSRPSIAAGLGLKPAWWMGGQVAILGVLGALLWYVWAVGRVGRRQIQLEQIRLAAMVQGSMDVIIACDNQGRVTHWNPAAERLLDISAGHALGQDVEDLLVDLAGGRMLAQGADEAGARRLSLRRPDGKTQDFMVIASPFSDANGRRAGTSLLLRDTTDEVRAEKHFRLVVEASPNAILMVDNAGIIHLANVKSEELFGYPRSELLGQSIAKLLPDDVRGGHDAFIGRYFAAPEARPMGAGRDLYCLRRDGARVPVEIGLNPIVTADGRYALASVIDITERKRQEAHIIRLNATLEQQVADRTEQIRTYSSRLSAILQHAGYAIVATDVEGTINLFNPAAERMLGYGAGELIERKNIECLHDEEDLRAKSANASMIDGREVKGTFAEIAAHLEHQVVDIPEWTYRRKDGQPLPVRLSISVLRDDRGNTMGYLVMAFDLTEQKMRDSELRGAISEAEKANRYKSDFLANMSHEIRTPMNAILGLLYLMDRTGLPAAAQDMTRKIRLAAQSLLSIINDVLDFSKIEAGRIELEDAPFDLADVLESVAALMASSVDAKSVEMLISPAPQGARHLRGDAFRLGQVLVNLVSNAIKFTQQGEVGVRVEHLSPAAEGFVRLGFSVTDTGIGIPEEKQQSIFSPFSQVDSSTTRKYGGTGLGLSICKRLVQLMGGTLEVDSRPGVGSRFHFEIPLAVDAQAQAESSKGTCRVLVVDDHDIVREHLGLIIQSFGWTAHAVDSGEKAIQMLDRPGAGHYNVILMDWQMPGMDGLQTATLIRNGLPSSGQPIIIMVTGFERKAIEHDHRRDDVDAVLTKPVTASALYNAVSEVMARRGTAGIALAPQASVDRRLGGYRLLVVDDSDINREVAQRILEGEGAQVTLACDGRQALEVLQAQPDRFDVVLMDVQMPELDGYEATIQIRRTPSLKDLPVIALTAGAFKRQQDAALGAGMNAFVAKPFEVPDLVASILQFARRAPGTKAASAAEPVADAARFAAGDIDSQLLDLDKGLGYWRDPTPYRRYLAQFARRYVGVVDVLEGLMRAGDKASACAELHKMRGAAASLALPALAAATAEMEERLREGEVARDLLPNLRLVLHETLDDIRQYVSAGPLVDMEVADPDQGAASSLAEVLHALDSDDPERIDAAVGRISRSIPFDDIQEIRRYVEEFDFRGAETFIACLKRQGEPDGAISDREGQE